MQFYSLKTQQKFWNKYINFLSQKQYSDFLQCVCTTLKHPIKEKECRGYALPQTRGTEIKEKETLKEVVCRQKLIHSILSRDINPTHH